MRFPTIVRVFDALAIVLASVPAFATEQARDTISFGGRQDLVLERPLNEFLKRLPEVPRFDIPNTANYKGYSARWAVKDSRLYLASFSATTNRQPYSISSLFQGRRLPIHADWYSGTVHITSGRQTFTQGPYTYERVAVLQVTNGVLIATNVMSNVSEDKLKK